MVEVRGEVEHVLLAAAVRPVHQDLGIEVRLEETGAHHITYDDDE